MGALPPILDIDKAHIVEHCASIVPYLKGQKIFIAGGTGFFGTWLLEGLSAIHKSSLADFSVTVLTRDINTFVARSPHVAKQTFIDFVEGDVKNLSTHLDKSTVTFDSIIHAATETRASRSHSDTYDRISTIVDGTKNVLQLAVGKQVSRLLYISSGAVYGRQPFDLVQIPEGYLGGPDPLNKDSSYGEAKRLAEHLCVLAQGENSGLSIPIARCFAFHGAHLPLDQHFAAGNFLRDVMSHQQISILGDGTPRRSYLYGADLVIWLLHLLYRGRSGVAYNVGSDQDMSIVEVARETASALNEPHNIVIMKEADKNVLPERYIPDVTRCKTELGLLVRIPFQEQVKRTAQWHALKSGN